MLGANEMVMGKSHFEQWLGDMAYAKVKYYHGNNGIFSAEEYCQECLDKWQTQSFSKVRAQHQNAQAEHAIQTIMYMAWSFMVHASLHWTDQGLDDISLMSICLLWQMCAICPPVIFLRNSMSFLTIFLRW